MDIRESILSKRNLQSHLDTFKQRLAGEGLSVLELREQYIERMEQLDTGGLSTDKTMRLTAELALLDETARDLEGPEPTPADEVQYLRDEGRYESAEHLEYSNKRFEAERTVQDLEARLEANDYENDWKRDTDQRGLKDAREALEAIPLQPPSVYREQARQKLLDEAESLNQVAGSHEATGKETLRQKAEDLRSQATQKQDEARSMPLGDAGAKAAFYQEGASE